tara:strand:+ start:293 stop:1123 length:831 start_codon:yes stop_codon:yes gene_type:complete
MKKLLLVLIFPIISYGQVNCIKGEWPNCYGEIKENSQGEYWKGYFKNKYPWNGYGKTINDNGGEFEGEWKEGEWWNGKGKLIYTNDGWFEGEIKEGEIYSGEEYIKLTSGAKCNIYYDDGKEIKRICNDNNIRNSADIISGPKSKKINLISSNNANAFYLNLTINNEKVKFHFDTGCSIFTMNISQWNRLRKDLDYQDLNVLSNVNVVGSEVTTRYYKILEPIHIDDFSIKNVIVGVTQITSPEDHEKDNLIGIGFFKKFSNVIWNMDEATLEINK